MDLSLAIRRAGAADRPARPPRSHFRLPPGSVRAVGPIDDGYPIGAHALRDPPAVLFVRGADPLPPRFDCLAIVGARRCTAEGRSIARHMAAAAVEAGLVVVSGLALGIDAAAHEGAVDAGGRTLAVLASAVDHPTPQTNARLADEILDSGGWLLSERPPGAAVEGRSFPIRNRIVAAVSGAVLVIEAGLPSGTLTTIKHALAVGTLVGAVPGSVLSPASAGANALIRHGAVPVTCVDDAVGLLRMRTRPAQTARRTDEDAVLRGIPGASAPVEDWISASGLPPGQARACLLALIARGELRRQGRRVLRAAP